MRHFGLRLAVVAMCDTGIHATATIHVNESTIAHFCGSTSVFFGGVGASFGDFEFWRNRWKVSELTRKIDSKVQASKLRRQNHRASVLSSPRLPEFG